MTKLSTWMLSILVLVAFSYALFFYFEFGFEKLGESWWNWLFFNKVFFFLLPIYAIVLYINRDRFKAVDFSLLYIPTVTWLFLAILGGGSGVNHLIVNPAMIGCVSGFYFLRFYFIDLKTKGILKISSLWFLIFSTCFLIHLILPVFPE
jgi:hypothetical protein